MPNSVEKLRKPFFNFDHQFWIISLYNYRLFNRLAREEQDREFAEMLQAKEKAKLQRAKERAKLKKQQQRQQQQQQQLHEGEEVEQLSGELQQLSHHHHHHHERALSQPVSLNVSGGGGQISGASRAESRQSRRSDGGMASAAGALANGRHSRTSANSRSFEEDVRPPARRPYMNPGKDFSWNYSLDEVSLQSFFYSPQLL